MDCWTLSNQTGNVARKLEKTVSIPKPQPQPPGWEWKIGPEKTPGCGLKFIWCWLAEPRAGCDAEPSRKRSVSQADTTSPLIHGIHQHVQEHTCLATASAPPMCTSFLVVFFFFFCYDFCHWQLAWVTVGNVAQWLRGDEEGKVRGRLPLKLLQSWDFPGIPAVEMCH